MKNILLDYSYSFLPLPQKASLQQLIIFQVPIYKIQHLKGEA